MDVKLVVLLVTFAQVYSYVVDTSGGFECYGVVCPRGTSSCSKSRQTNTQMTQTTVTCLDSLDRAVDQFTKTEKTKQEHYTQPQRCYGVLCPAGTASCRQIRQLYNSTTTQTTIKCLNYERFTIQEFVLYDPISKTMQNKNIS